MLTYKNPIKINGVLCNQVIYTTAMKMYNAGKTVYLHPNLMRLDSMWQQPYAYQKTVECDRPFAALYNSFMYYNCNKEAGKRILCFVAVKDLKR